MVDSRAFELKTQALLIRGLKQSWTEVTMNLDSQPNHPLAQITTVRQAHDPPYPPCPPCLRGYQKPRLLGERLEIFDADHARRLEHGVECGDPVERAAHRRLDIGDDPGLVDDHQPNVIGALVALHRRAGQRGERSSRDPERRDLTSGGDVDEI